MGSKKILLVGYCNLHDGFLYASNALKKIGNIMYFFPYMGFQIDNIHIDEINLRLINFIIENNISHVLWWNNRISYQNIDYIIKNTNVNNTNIKNMFFNWDPYLYDYERYNCYFWKDSIEERVNICKLMNCTFSCFEREINYLRNKTRITYLPPGFDPEISKFEYDPEYECDISIVCTNLYNDRNIFPIYSNNIERSDVVNMLYSHRDKIKFHIYGPEFLNEIYPECYKGFIKYDKSNKVFSNSKINLSLHPMTYSLHSPNSREDYFSERVPQILGCRGLLVSNSYYNNILKDNSEYVFIGNNEWFDKIMYVLEHYDDYQYIRENGYQVALANYTWDKWAEKIHHSVMNNFTF